MGRSSFDRGAPLGNEFVVLASERNHLVPGTDTVLVCDPVGVQSRRVHQIPRLEILVTRLHRVSALVVADGGHAVAHEKLDAEAFCLVRQRVDVLPGIDRDRFRAVERRDVIPVQFAFRQFRVDPVLVRLRPQPVQLSLFGRILRDHDDAELLDRDAVRPRVPLESSRPLDGVLASSDPSG